MGGENVTDNTQTHCHVRVNPNEQIHYFNNIKSFLALLVVFFHTSSGYGGEGGWYYVEQSDNLISTSILTLLNALCQSFFMGLFFFLSAYFIPKSYEKRGTFLFLKSRILKLLVPALFYFFVLNPLCIYLVSKQSYFSSLDFYNTWFIMALLYFSIIYVLIKRFVSPTIDQKKIDFLGKKKILVFILVMGLFNFVVRLIFPTDKMYIHDFTLGYFPQYIALFSLGIVAFRNNLLDKIEDKTVSIYFRVSLISSITMPLVFFLSSFYSNGVENFFGGFTFESFYYSFWEPFTYVGIILKILTVFRDKLDFTAPFMNLVNQTSYSIYIIQAPIIVILQLMLAALDLNVFMKVFLVTVLTFIISFGISALLLKISVLRKILT
nr:acyltransferase family protein [Bacillus benzoevorans]